jgi:hypothetical protein
MVMNDQSANPFDELPHPSAAKRSIGNSSINTTAALGSRSKATLDERFMT